MLVLKLYGQDRSKYTTPASGSAPLKAEVMRCTDCLELFSTCAVIVAFAQPLTVGFVQVQGKLWATLHQSARPLTVMSVKVLKNSPRISTGRACNQRIHGSISCYAAVLP